MQGLLFTQQLVVAGTATKRFRAADKVRVVSVPDEGCQLDGAGLSSAAEPGLRYVHQLDSAPLLPRLRPLKKHHSFTTLSIMCEKI